MLILQVISKVGILLSTSLGCYTDYPSQVPSTNMATVQNMLAILSIVNSSLIGGKQQ